MGEALRARQSLQGFFSLYADLFVRVHNALDRRGIFAFDVVVGTAIACGGYAVAILVYIMNRGKYHPLVRSALVTSALGYTLAGVSVIIDLGRWVARMAFLQSVDWRQHGHDRGRQDISGSGAEHVQAIESGSPATVLDPELLVVFGDCGDDDVGYVAGNAWGVGSESGGGLSAS